MQRDAEPITKTPSGSRAVACTAVACIAVPQATQRAAERDGWRAPKATPPRGVPDWLELARRLLHEHHGPGLRMWAIADEVGVHPVHLSRAFRHHFGTTMSAYLRDLRVRRACEELRHTRHSLARIAIAVGFSDHAHFTRVFKEVHGLTPTQYRGQSRPVSSGEAPERAAVRESAARRAADLRALADASSARV